MDSGHHVFRLNAAMAPSTSAWPPLRPSPRENNNPPGVEIRDSGGPSAIQVWRKNLSAEVERITTFLRLSYRFVSIDTEFPGFLRSTPRGASEEQRYRDLKFNVDRIHLVQLGLALFNDAGQTPWPGCHWQINFCNFDPAVDACSHESVEFLLRSGHDLRKYQREGVSVRLCSLLMRYTIFDLQHNAKFVTFHGLYDVAYVIKLITGEPLPETLIEFLVMARRLLGDFCDVKQMAKFLPGLRRGELSLMKISSIVLGDMKPPGICHQAGYDSLLTGAVYHQLKIMHNIDDADEESFSSVLYGFQEGCVESKRLEEMVVAPPPPPPYANFTPCTGFVVFQAPPPPAPLGAHNLPMQLFRRPGFL